MDKNYYDILQVNKNASPEIIEKAFKTLAKKYHPDLQPEENKKQSEEIFKQINEAYEVLSDSEKKKNYDNYLIEQELKNKKIENNYSTSTQQIHNNSKPINQISEELLIRKQQELLHQQEIAYQQQIQQARQKAYHDAYIQDLKNRGYKIKYKKTIKERFKDFIALIITFLILFLIFQTPIIKNFFINLYEENTMIRILVDVVVNLFNSLIQK